MKKQNNEKEKSAGSKPRRRVFVVDDHPIMREGVVRTICSEPGLEVCGQAEDAKSALLGIAETVPEIVIADISLPDTSGIELIKDLKIRHPKILTLVLSMHTESVYAERSLKAGARGYLMKHEAPDKLIAAICRVLAGEVYVSGEIAQKLLSSIAGSGEKALPMDRLTDRELEIVRLTGEGRVTKEIALDLHISVKTVETHKANIKKKLDLETHADLTRFAYKWVETEK